MSKPFIRNHQFNLIKKQANVLLSACRTVSDRNVVEAVRQSVQVRILEEFPDATELQRQTLEGISSLNEADEFQQYLLALEPYLTEFPRVTENQLKKLYPKIKKLKVPDLSVFDFRYATYLGWTDIGTHKLFLVYQLNGQLVGIEGRYTPVNKKSVCVLCSRQEDVALFSAVTKSKPANASPDYYKAVGNYLCVDSSVCNKNMTDIAALEKLVQEVLGK